MEIRNLITFVQVADLGSFTKAAKVLDYAQSTISFQIKQLESELNCLLFERIGHTITLTEEGRELLSYARQITRLTDEFEQSRGEAGAPEGLLRMAAPDSVCEEMISNNYAHFHSLYPGLALRFINTDTDTMFRMLAQNEVDLVVTLDTHIYQSEFIIAKEEPVNMHFVTGANSPYANLGKVSVRDIVDAPFLLTEKRISYRRSLDEALAKMSLEIQPILELGRTDVITRLLENGTGISFLPDFVTDRMVEQGRLCYIDVTDIDVSIWKQLIHHRNKWISPALRVLMEYIQKMEFRRA